MVYDPVSMFRFAVDHRYSHVLSLLTVVEVKVPASPETTAAMSTRLAPPEGRFGPVMKR